MSGSSSIFRTIRAIHWSKPLFSSMHVHSLSYDIIESGNLDQTLPQQKYMYTKML